MKNSYLHIRQEDSFNLVELAGGRGHSLNTAALHEIEALCTLESGKSAFPIVFWAQGNSFCTGLDLNFSMACDRDSMREFMVDFHKAVLAVFSWPAPVIAAIDGHCLAGGAILALACDERFMAMGSASFGIHGAQMGIPYPQVVTTMLSFILPPKRVESLLYGGRLRKDRRAMEEGLIHRLTESVDLLQLASARCSEMSQFGLGVFGQQKMLLRQKVIASLKNISEDGMEAWLDGWFNPSTQAMIKIALHSNKK